jgi:hypothetical protein
MKIRQNQNLHLDDPERLERPLLRLDRPTQKIWPWVNPQLLIARSPDSPHGLWRNFGIAQLPLGQPLP